MTWAMVEAYGLGADVIDPVAPLTSKATGLLAALHAEDPPTLERLWRIHVEWLRLDQTLGTIEFPSPSDGQRLSDAICKGEAWIVRAGAAHVLQHTWGVSAKVTWSPEATLKRLVALCEGTIFPILSQNDVIQENRVVSDVLWKSCWASVQQPLSKLPYRALIDCIRGFRRLAYGRVNSTDQGLGNSLHALVPLLERLLEMRYVLKVMQQERVRGAPRRQAKKAFNRQAGKVEKVLKALEWPPEFAPGMAGSQ